MAGLGDLIDPEVGVQQHFLSLPEEKFLPVFAGRTAHFALEDLEQQRDADPAFRSDFPDPVILLADQQLDRMADPVMGSFDAGVSDPDETLQHRFHQQQGQRFPAGTVDSFQCGGFPQFRQDPVPDIFFRRPHSQPGNDLVEVHLPDHVFPDRIMEPQISPQPERPEGVAVAGFVDEKRSLGRRDRIIPQSNIPRSLDGKEKSPRTDQTPGPGTVDADIFGSLQFRKGIIFY